MAQDFETNDTSDDAVPTFPLGPLGGYPIESLVGSVCSSDSAAQSDPSDWYKVQYTGGVTSVNLVSLGLWYARESVSGFEVRSLEIQLPGQFIALSAIYYPDGEIVYSIATNDGIRDLADPSGFKLPSVEVDPKLSSFLVEIKGFVTVDEGTRPISYDIDLSFSGMIGPTEFNDTLYGQDGIDNTIRLLAGDDTYFGLSGNDTIYGERGDDTLDGGKGNDLLDGGTGKDTMRGGAGNDSYWVDDLGDVVDESAVGADGIDVVRSSVTFSLSGNQALGEIENLMLVGGRIDGTGNDRNNVIVGTTRDNKLSGRVGNDKLDGGSGNDTLKGDGGNDILIGGKGADYLWGGTGKDTFAFKSPSDSTIGKDSLDIIYDFAKGDRFDLIAIDADARKAGNQAFTWIGTDKFHGKAGELRFEKKASDTYVYADMNGDKKTDFAFQLDDPLKLDKSDFLL